MKIIRTFNPVGHGGFYSEEFENQFILIYDCGGRKKDVIEHEISNSIERHRFIDAVFISHFHNDHINGLKYLLNEYKVRNIFLPELHSNSVMQLLIENHVMGPHDPFTEGIIIDPEETIRNSPGGGETNIIFIKPGEENFQSESQQELIPIKNLKNGIHISSGSRISMDSAKSEWIFVPFNFQFLQYSNQLIRKLKENRIETKEDLIRKLKNDLRWIIDIYTRLFDGKDHFNTNSLALYSGPNIPHERFFRESYLNSYFVLNSWPRYYYGEPGCLYLGDYDAKNNFLELSQVYKPWWDNIGSIQIPHHGSKYNYHEGLTHPGMISVIAADGRKHPHSYTLKKIIANNGIPIILTEQAISRLIQVITIEN